MLPKISPLHVTADIEYHMEGAVKVVDKATVVRVDLCSHPQEPLDSPVHDQERERWCECEHPLSWHDDEGRCQAPKGSSEAELATDCFCQHFVEAQGDTLENLGVDLL